MRKLLPLVLILLMLPLAAGCDNPLNLNINKDPDAATSVPGDLLLPTVLANLASNRSIEISPGTAFFTQIWASSGSAGVFVDPERYTMSSYTTGNTWQALYTDGLKNLLLMRDQALSADPPRANVAAQAEIMSGYVFWMLTSLWETVPYTQALDGANYPHPVFDDQQTVLNGILTKLDSAIALIDPNGLAGVVTGDLVYGGDMSLWRRFANSLKLRTLMMIRNNDVSVDSDIQALLSQPLIRENAQEADIPFFNTANNENNLWKLNNMFGGFTNAMNGNEFVFAGDTFVNMMKAVNDPRLATYFEFAVNDFNTSPDGGGAATTEYFGQLPGHTDWNDAHSSMLSQNIIRTDWPSRMATAAETWLYEAEYLASTGDLNGAHTSYVAGIQRALDYFDGKPGAIAAADKQSYLAALPQSFTSQLAALDAIHAQEYFEVFDRSPENWVYWRRTHYPALPLPEQAVLGDVIRRYPMPPDEVSANPSAPSGIQLDLPMWFEK